MGVAQVLNIGQSKDEIAQLKELYLQYYETVPKKKFAAQFIGRTEEAVLAWEKNDPEFLARLLEAESKNVKKTLVKTKPEWQLERNFPEEFGEQAKESSPTIIVMPIYGGTSNVIQGHLVNPQDLPVAEANPGSSGGNFSLKDDLNSSLADRLRSEHN